MRLSTKLAALLMPLLCLSVSGCSTTRDAVSNAPALVSSAPSPQNVNAGSQNVSAGPKNDNVEPKNEKIEPKSESPLPPPTGFVNDYANVFDAESKARLESALKELRDKSGVEFAVVTIETTGERPIYEYSLDVAKGWGIGPKDASKGGGMLLMLAAKDRKWRLQVSRSLEKDLPDAECKRLGERSRELYAEGKYAEGVTKYVGALVARLEEKRGFKLSQKLSGGQRRKRRARRACAPLQPARAALLGRAKYALRIEAQGTRRTPRPPARIRLIHTLTHAL